MHLIETTHLNPSPDEPFTEFEGRPFGAGVTFIIVDTDKPGLDLPCTSTLTLKPS